MLRCSALRLHAGRRGTTRKFRTPSNLIDLRFGCTFFAPKASAACLNGARPPNVESRSSTYVGTYQPYVYLPAGLAIRAARSPEAGLLSGRAATLLVSLALLLAATWLLWSPLAPGVSMIGLLTAISPMVAFVSTVLSPAVRR